MLQRFVIRLILCGIIVFNSLSSNAQTVASFEADKLSGCSPLEIKFSNTSQVSSQNADYKWDFGNGNVSTLKDPGAIYTKQGNYEITLTVTDQGRTSVSKKTITVHSSPEIDFSASLDKGCAPLPVTFSAQINPSDRNGSKYVWDFGDGATEENWSASTTHTYIQKQNVTASLTVIDNYGCQATVVKKDILNVMDSLIVDFDAEKKVLCDITEAAVFINRTKGPGTLSYSWDFGDGSKSTSVNPSHVFNTRKIYTISLEATNTDGCKASLTKDQYINAAYYSTDFETTGALCAQTYIQLNNKSNPAPDETEWQVNNDYVYMSYGTQGFNYYFQDPGTYNVRMKNKFGTCVQEIVKQIEVKPRYEPVDFVAEYSTPCGAPVTVTFKDTSSASVSWTWSLDYYQNTISNQRSFSYTYQNRSDYNPVILTANNKDGCSFITQKIITTSEPWVSIYHEEENGVVVCGPRKIKFYANTSETISEYKWTFGDGQTSTEKEPIHLFSKEGQFNVTLSYKLANGCTGVANIYYLKISFKKELDFYMPSTEICGNTPFTVSPVSNPGDYVFHWDFGDGTWNTSYNTHKYQQEGEYQITMIGTNYICSDTVVKTVKVKPPFPRISHFTNTCEGTRGKVIISHTSEKITSGTWDFGDGTTAPYVQNSTEIEHVYTKTGKFKVVLTAVNGSCTVKDSINVDVLLKLKPVVKPNKNEICGTNDPFTVTLNNIVTNPAQYSPEYWYNLYTENGDHIGSGPWTVGYTYENNFHYAQIPRGTQQIRAVVQSTFFNCYDTTEFVPLKVKGPQAGYQQIYPDTCLSGIYAILQDTSKSFNNVPIVKWEWNFGNGKTQLNTSAELVVPRYEFETNPYVTLKVTDADGCTYTTPYYQYVYARNHTIKAAFNTSSTFVSPGTTVHFTNNSTTSHPSNTTYKWILGDGSVVNSYNAQETFATPGEYTVKLIATNNEMGCSDSSVVNITVKYVNSAFSMNTSLIGNNQCLPALVRFYNSSYNYSYLTWDFGDGTVIKNVTHPSHVYTQPGKYYITLTTESDNGTKYITKDSIEIKNTSGSFITDKLHSCNAENIKFSSSATNTDNYTWDFGDGNVISGIEAVRNHLYNTAGVYTPTLVLKDEFGCPTKTEFTDKIIIDSLAVSLADLPAQFCSPKQITMVPRIVNVAAGQQNQNLTYHWNFGTGNVADTSDQHTPAFTYLNAGSYNVSLTVKSTAGCMKKAETTLTANEGLGGQISGPIIACVGEPVNFEGSTIKPGSPAWKWIFPDNTTSNQKNPPAYIFNSPGKYPVKLVIDNQSCVVTTTHFIDVSPNPLVTIEMNKNYVCKGEGILLTASGGQTYTWAADNTLNTTTGAAVTATPQTATEYKVAAENEFGCTGKDSVLLEVIAPFTLQLTGKENICEGETVQLNASGADKYQWIENIAGLNNTVIANPIAKPSQSTTYTVVAYDNYQCFYDTARISIELRPAPTVNVGADAEILAGTQHKLNPVFSQDVVEWNWNPSTYLSCSDCPSPNASPVISQQYELTVKNEFGCAASDSVFIKLLCEGTKALIPTAFTPNNDGLNDRFMITGYGVSEIKSLQIFNRWGELIFERKNIMPGDMDGGWDGTFKGKPVDTGTYVYFTELKCGLNSFQQKGTVTLIR